MLSETPFNVQHYDFLIDCVSSHIISCVLQLTSGNHSKQHFVFSTQNKCILLKMIQYGQRNKYKDALSTRLMALSLSGHLGHRLFQYYVVFLKYE